MAPRARLLFQPAQAPAPVHSSPSPARSVAHQPLPPASPLHAVEGLFSLLPGGGIRVGERAVRVPPGTVIERLEPRAHEAGDGTKGVRWSGSDEQGQPGRWTLWLLGATEGDLLAVHRILLHLPPDSPLPPPRPFAPHARPAPPPPGPRNSLLLYDESTRSVRAVLPLAAHGQPRACPTPPQLPFPHPHAAPSPTHHPSAASFAAYVDHITAALHPSPTPEELCREEHAARHEIERLAAEETADDELRLPPAPEMLELIALPAQPAHAARAEATEEAGRQPQWRDERRELEKGFARLDLETELARGPAVRARKAAAPPTARNERPASIWTVSSLATYGTERFVTADEADEAEERTSSWRDLFAVPHDDDAATPRVSRHGVIAPMDAVVASPPDSATSFDPTHTLTNGNAVLLSFLGGPSVVLPSSTTSSSAKSAPQRIAVTAHPLSAQQASEMEQRGEIECAVMDAPTTEPGSRDQSEGWWAWLFGLVGVRQTSQPADKVEATGWLSWLPLPSLLPSALSVGTSIGSQAGDVRRRPRKAAGEATSRLSVFHFDETGTGRRAFVART